MGKQAGSQGLVANPLFLFLVRQARFAPVQGIAKQISALQTDAEIGGILLTYQQRHAQEHGTAFFPSCLRQIPALPEQQHHQDRSLAWVRMGLWLMAASMRYTFHCLNHRLHDGLSWLGLHAGSILLTWSHGGSDCAGRWQLP